LVSPYVKEKDICVLKFIIKVNNLIRSMWFKLHLCLKKVVTVSIILFLNLSSEKWEFGNRCS